MDFIQVICTIFIQAPFVSGHYKICNWKKADRNFNPNLSEDVSKILKIGKN